MKGVDNVYALIFVLETKTVYKYLMKIHASFFHGLRVRIIF